MSNLRIVTNGCKRTCYEPFFDEQKMNRKEALKIMGYGTAGAITFAPLVHGATSKAIPSIGAGPPDEDRGTHWRNSALIVVDMQNDFVRVGAPLEVPDARKTIGAQQSLLRSFRKRSLPVIFTKFISHPHYYLLWDWSPQCQPPTKCCWKGHERFYSDINGNRECTEVIDELRPEPTDIVVEKNGYGAFHNTNLADLLRKFGLNSVVITGTVTQICVEETAREAFHHGFRATLVEDAVSSFAPDLHAAAIKNFGMKFGWVDRSETIVSTLA
jgi:nicotinamidase-related amidase